MLSCKGKQRASGLFLGSCLHSQSTHQMQSFGKTKRDEISYDLAWNDDGESAFVGKQRGYFRNEQGKRQVLVVSSQGTRFVVGQRVLGEERRIAEDGVETLRWAERQNVLATATYTTMERTFRHVLLCLPGSCFVYLDAEYLCIRVSLCSHQGNETGACADIKNRPALDASPCAQQYAVGSHLHGTAVVPYAKLLELKEIVHLFLGARSKGQGAGVILFCFPAPYSLFN